MTCVEHWLEDFEIDEYLAISCPRDSPCRTFKEEYGNGEGLCNQLLGNGLFYSTDSDNCTVMAFDNSLPNPNFKLTFPRSGIGNIISLTVKLGSIIVIPLLMFLVNAATI